MLVLWLRGLLEPCIQCNQWFKKTKSKNTMTSKKSGFAGLGNLVSDLSDVAPPSEKPSSSPQTNNQVESQSTRQEHSQPRAKHQETERQATPARQVADQSATTNNQPNGGSSGAGWVVGIGLFILFIVFASSGGNNGNQPSNGAAYSPAPSKPAISQYEQAIETLKPEVERLLGGMLTASQANDFVSATLTSVIVEKLAKETPQSEKPQTKEARAQNALGLKALKEQRKEAAAQNFFAAYKANPRDTEIANNFGEALYEIGDYSAAKKAYLASLALTPKRTFAWVSLGKVFARNGDTTKASSAFGLAFQYAKSPRQMRQSIVSLFHDDENITVKSAARTFLVQSYTSAVPEFLRPVLPNLANVTIPVFLPAKVSPRDSEGKPMQVVAVNNEMYGIEATADSYKIPFASEPDCRATYCAIGVLSGRRVSPSDVPEEGEQVEITGGIVGKIVRDNFRNTSRFIFRVADVEYTFALSADASDDVASSNSALKLGSIPVDAFAGETKLERSTPATPAYAPPPTYAPPSQPYTPPSQAYTPPTKNALECNVSYTVSLQTIGEGVTVELRQGMPGNSRAIKTSYSSGGNVFFSGLCPGSYFLAIGNGESVSVTPVRSFETGIDYTSTLTMQRGTGNVSSRRKSDL